MRIGSLFSGYGGLDLAALQLFPSSSVAWHCEWDDAPAKILDHHWPTVPNFRDVTGVDWSTVEPVDILTGGYPCQPFSAAGKRKGTNDERHLWPYVREAIRDLRPRFTLLENVAGHRSMGFDRVLGDCAEDGLHVRWTSVRASDIGACHRRERLFILISPDPSRDGRNQGRTESARQQRRPDASERGDADVAHTPGDGRPRFDDRTSSQGPRSEGERLSGRGAGSSTASMKLFPTPKASDGVFGTPRTSGRPPEKATHLGTIVSLLPTPNASDGSGGGQHPTKREGHSRQLIDYALLAGSQDWGAYEAAIRHQESLSRVAPSPTEPNTKGNPRLAAAFSEWMMFLPQGWVTDPSIGLSRNDQLKAIGNGVCPPQAVAAYSSLLQMEVVA